MIEAQDWKKITADELEEMEGEDAILLVRREKDWMVLTPFSNEDTADILAGLSHWFGRVLH